VTKNVRGILFVDYVRMVRSTKHVDWSKHLNEADLRIISERVDPEGWYPMSTFERLGLGILREIAQGQLDGVKMWGRFQVDAVCRGFPAIVSEGDPRETLMRFDVLAGSFFEPSALRVLAVSDSDGLVEVRYGMSPVAEETASHQTLGFFERLVEIGGGKAVDARFKSRSWAGDTRTIIALNWDPPGDANRPKRAPRTGR
jgi:hypothetical protein